MAASSPDEGRRATKSEEDADSPAQAQHATSTEVSTEGPETNANAMHGFKLLAIFVGICFGAFLMSLDIFVIATAIPSITSDFKDTSQLAWYPAAYSLTTCALTPLAGKLSSTFPLRWIYISFFSVFLVGSLVCGFAPNSNTFIAGRAIAGIGASDVVSGGFVIVLTVSPRNRNHFIGGAFTEKATWRWCFWVNLPPGALTLLSILCFFKPPFIQRDRTVVQRIMNLDLIGCAIFIPATFMLLLAMMWVGTEKDWDSATIIGLFVGSGVMLILFVLWEGYKGRTRRESVAEWYARLAAVLSQIVRTLSAGILALRILYYNPWLYVGPLSCAPPQPCTRNSQHSTPHSATGSARRRHDAAKPSLIVQQAVRDKPELMPVAVSLNLFFQYLGVTVTQVLGGIVFRSILASELANHAGLKPQQIALLSAAGTGNVRGTAEQRFPGLLNLVLEAYNMAITSTFFVAVATSTAAFFLAFGVEWERITDKRTTDPEEAETEQQ
ncbi:putative HC-toxin efflux carrier TOXA [Aspergillus udagawae]|nr:putative HC-toxin efflux carrier TOXA [Aspergillus udagawae]